MWGGGLRSHISTVPKPDKIACIAYYQLAETVHTVDNSASFKIALPNLGEGGAADPRLICLRKCMTNRMFFSYILLLCPLPKLIS